MQPATLPQTSRGGGKTTITLSLEESRTQLGAEANGIYPVSWSEGDVISVNGVPSQSIAIADGGKIATFTFDGAINYPYCVAYPASAEGKVTFATPKAHSLMALPLCMAMQRRKAVCSSTTSQAY